MIKTAKDHITRSPYQSLAAVFVLTLSLFLVSVFFFIGSGSQLILRHFETRPQVSAYLKDEAQTGDIDLIKAKIGNGSKVKNIEYISKDQALEIYKEQNKDKPLLLEMVSAKILPASLEVSTYDLASLKEVAEKLKQEAMVEDVVYHEDVVSSLSKWMATVRKFGLGIAVFLLFIAVMTILIILGMKISQRKEEMEILKLLGASPSYISSPFYLEGMFYGIVAAFVSWVLSYGAILGSGSFLTQFLAGIPLLPVSPVFMIEVLGGLLFLGIFVGFVGSALAVSRFNKAIR
jgi:cell division transport system permease protein